MRAFKKQQILLAAVLALHLPSALAAIHTAGFDSLDANAQIAPGYGAFDEGAVHFTGFDWGQITVAQAGDGTLHPLAVGFEHGVASPSNVAFNPNGSAASVSISSLSAPFIFVGAKFTAWFNLADLGLPGGMQTLTVAGWNGAHLLYEDTRTLSAFSQLDFSAPAVGIDRLVLRTDVTFNGQSTRPLQWMMDDFNYSLVPEPGTMLQLAAGLLMMFAFSLRRRLPH